MHEKCHQTYDTFLCQWPIAPKGRVGHGGPFGNQVVLGEAQMSTGIAAELAGNHVQQTGSDCGLYGKRHSGDIRQARYGRWKSRTIGHGPHGVRG